MCVKYYWMVRTKALVLILALWMGNNPSSWTWTCGFINTKPWTALNSPIVYCKISPISWIFVSNTFCHRHILSHLGQNRLYTIWFGSQFNLQSPYSTKNQILNPRGRIKSAYKWNQMNNLKWFNPDVKLFCMKNK